MSEHVLRTNRRATLEVISPLHVGAGTGPLLQDYDFVFQRGVVWVMDSARVLERFSEEELRHGIPDVRLSTVLRPKDYPACAAYTLAAPGTVSREILPFLKDVQGRPYLPGSSLKGALRTVVGWAAAGSEGRAPTAEEVLPIGRPNAKYAGSRWERRVFGASPNYDLMRGLLVDDTGPVPVESLELSLVAIHSLRGARLEPKGPDYRFSVEALKPGTLLECRVGVDEYVLNHPQLRLADRRAWIDGIVELGRRRAEELIQAEKGFYTRCGPRPLQQFYERLERTAAGLGEGQFLLQMSWGTGWGAKTLGPSLGEAPFFPQVRDEYRLGRRDAPFPKSRRLVERGGSPSEPVGWVKVTL